MYNLKVVCNDGMSYNLFVTDPKTTAHQIIRDVCRNKGGGFDPSGLMLAIMPVASGPGEEVTQINEHAEIGTVLQDKRFATTDSVKVLYMYGFEEIDYQAVTRLIADKTLTYKSEVSQILMQSLISYCQQSVVDSNKVGLLSAALGEILFFSEYRYP